MRKFCLIMLCILSLLLAGCGAEPVETAVPAETTLPAQTVDAAQTTAPVETTEPEVFLAPDFTVYDAEGNPVKLSDFFGKPIVLNFWASWCGPCKSEMPDFDTVYLQRGEQIQFLMINLTDGSMETLASAQSFLADAGYSFPVYFDTTGEAAAMYSVSSIPTTYMISKDGTLEAYAVGALDMETLLTGISMIDK